MNPTHQAKPSTKAKTPLTGKDPLATTQKIADLMEILATAKETAVRFEFEAGQDSTVFIAGTFNDWNPTSHPLEYRPHKNVFRAYLLLEEGTHEYKFVVNGVWQEDPKCPERVPDGEGEFNSVIHVQLPSRK